jgi:glycerophosphoryl diester phosphodiesterase
VASLPAWLSAKPVAHRGLHDNEAGVPENSLAAFKAAADASYAIELDVRLSDDRQAMVFHDVTLERMTGRPGKVAATSAADLRELRLLGTAEPIPMLHDVLRAVGGRVPLLIEVKNYGNTPVGALEKAVLDVLAGYTGEVAVQSFSPLVVEWFRGNSPNMARGQIVTTPGGLSSLTATEQQALAERLEAGIGAPQFIACNVEYLPSPLSERARAEGKPVLTWTVRSSPQWARAKAHADNVIFEHWRP